MPPPAEAADALLQRALGLWKVAAHTLRRAHAVNPIAAVQSEYSLCSRNVEISVLQACRAIGAALVAFSPSARGLLTGTLRDVAALHDKDLRRGMPRFQPDTYARNLRCSTVAPPSRATPAAACRSWRWPGCSRAVSR